VTTSRACPSSPRVSVVIPCYNSAEFIAETLNSVFAQTFQDHEVIVVNDGSPDTDAFEQAIAPYLPRLVYLKQRNTGPSGARNNAIRAARGEFVAFLDSDDQWLPTFLEEQVAAFDADAGLDLLYSDGIIFGAGPLVGRTLMSGSPSEGPVTFESLVREQCTVLTSTTMARRPALLEAGLFDERFVRCEDFHLWLKMVLNGARLGYHRRVLVRHRRREGSLAHNTLAMIRAFVDVIRDLEPRLTPAQRVLVDEQAARRDGEMALIEAKQAFVAEQYPQAVAALDRACALEPRMAQQLRLRAIRAAIRVAPRLLRRAYAI
jgi:glycosyltransferase involved in cell wall biosynthesis